jgi:tetratricopeptide (TPR) repeat protein
MHARLIRLSLSCAIALTACPCASLRATESNRDPVMARQSVDGSAVQVDEVALRYYASQKQIMRVDTETRRLQKLHPGWQPPSDLWTRKVGASDDRQLWDLFAANKLDELRSEISSRRAKDSNWRPSAELDLKLRRKELRPRILAQARAKRWNDLISAADKWRSDVAADDLEALWLVAEAYARTDHTPEAIQVLDAAMKSAGPSDRLATIQRALVLPLPMSGVELLLTLGKLDAAGKSEFDAIAVDLTRGRISASLREMPSKEVSATDYARFKDFAVAATDPDQTALLGWYALKQSKTSDALDHFKTAIAKGGDATVAQGLVIALRKLGRLRDAEEVAYAWRVPSRANTTLFLDVVADQLTQRVPMDSKRLTRYADVTLQTMSGEGAEALGWYAYETCQTEAAVEWFKRAATWLPRETAVLGYALTLQRLQRTPEFVQIVNRYDGLFPTVVALMFPDGTTNTADRCQQLSTSMKNQSSATPKQAAGSAVPFPSQLAAALPSNLAARGGFPIAVAAENPLRSLSADRPPSLKTAATVWRVMEPVLSLTDARRVSGVGPMPYEQRGRSLLPGMGGNQQPSATPGGVVQAAKGTLWAAEQAEIVTSRQSADTGGQLLSLAPVASAAANRFHP